MGAADEDDGGTESDGAEGLRPSLQTYRGDETGLGSEAEASIPGRGRLRVGREGFDERKMIPVPHFSSLAEVSVVVEGGM